MPIDAKTKEVLDTRLVKGEITAEEYENLLKTMNKANETVEVAAPPAPPRVNPGVAHANEVAAGVRAGVASNKDFVGPAFLAWLLYYIGFYFVGLIVNICYLSSANSIERDTGVRPKGKGCLQFLMFIHFTLPLIAGIILAILVFGFGMELF